MNTACLLVNCADRTGLVAAVSEFIHRHNGNIIDADQHTDELDGRFYMRLQWELENFSLEPLEMEAALDTMAAEFSMHHQLYYSDRHQRVAVMCSRELHCVHDLLLRHQMGELDAQIAVVISNHPDAQSICEAFHIPFVYIEVAADNKNLAEAKQMAVLDEHDIDTVVLARYMQILSANFVDRWQGELINIHHSFLPAFAGAKPYHQAKQRGVKIIGATAHYVSTELDQGPIIEQDVCRISHRDTVVAMKRDGRDLERQVLARALRMHLEHRVMVVDNRTIVFE
ncbi:MAG: formyltetrahydrofolate deformylase [Planctomycetes bacterium]|nr:formyltetrahydrofolate deformylase [Planctomycetota bacterium]